MLHFRTLAVRNPHAEYIVDELNRARGFDVAYHLSHAFHSLQAHATAQRTVLSEAEAAEIILALDCASTDALQLFRDYADGVFAFQAIAKAKTLARYWASATKPHDGPEQDAIRNAIACVIWLRNCCHNFSLLEEIEEHHTARAREARQARLFCSSTA